MKRLKLQSSSVSPNDSPMLRAEIPWSEVFSQDNRTKSSLNYQQLKQSNQSSPSHITTHNLFLNKQRSLVSELTKVIISNLCSMLKMISFKILKLDFKLLSSS